MALKLSILDQSPVISGGTPAQAVQATLELARLGAEPRRMRIGTGGVLLPYYSAFKVAEVFRMLEALYPGRVDLGIGRAPGGDQRTAHAVAGGQFPSADDFPQRVWELVGHLDGTLPDDHPHRRVRVQPAATRRPRCGCLAPRTTAACSPRNWGCASPSRTSSTPRAATP